MRILIYQQPAKLITLKNITFFSISSETGEVGLNFFGHTPQEVLADQTLTT
jgi:hypothetical protein